MLRLLSIFTLCIPLHLVSYSQEFTFSENINKAYNHAISLKKDSAIYFLDEEKKQIENNLFIPFIYNYIDFLDVFTSGDLDLYENKIKSNFKRRIKSISESNLNSSPYFLYTQAEIHIHASIIAVIDKEYFNAIYHLRKSLKQLEENQKKFPEFKANKKSLGMLNSLLGSVPDQFKTGLSIIGLHGDIKKGMQMLEELSNDQQFEFQHETATIYAFMLFHLNNDKEGAWKILESQQFFDSRNLMDLYTIAHIGIYGNHNDEAIYHLENFKNKDGYIAFPFLKYLMGIAKTYRQDEDANLYFKEFLAEYKGIDYRKSSYQKMAWNEIIKGNDDKYAHYILQIKDVGRTQIDADKQAQKVIKSLHIPNDILLKARLLTDGNYTEEALELLKKYTINDFLMPMEKVEYQYRLGRIYQKQDKIDLAMLYYLDLMLIENKVEAYFTANACYLLAHLYEQKKDYNNALEYYQKCLTLNGYQYHNSIMLKAKAGHNRLKKTY